MRYCPEIEVTRAHMGVFLGRAVHGRTFTPPSATGIFNNVATNYWVADWIEQFYKDGITKGFGTNPMIYCPTNPVIRAQRAAFIARTFAL